MRRRTRIEEAGIWGFGKCRRGEAVHGEPATHTIDGVPARVGDHTPWQDCLAPVPRRRRHPRGGRPSLWMARQSQKRRELRKMSALRGDGVLVALRMDCVAPTGRRSRRVHAAVAAPPPLSQRLRGVSSRIRPHGSEAGIRGSGKAAGAGARAARSPSLRLRGCTVVGGDNTTPSPCRPAP